MEDYRAWAESVLQKVREKMEWVSEKNRDKIPYTTDERGDYDDRSDENRTWRVDDGINWWTNGFWGGIMWLLYQDTKEERYAQIARVSERKMEKCKIIKRKGRIRVICENPKHRKQDLYISTIRT